MAMASTTERAKGRRDPLRPENRQPIRIIAIRSDITRLNVRHDRVTTSRPKHSPLKPLASLCFAVPSALSVRLSSSELMQLSLIQHYVYAQLCSSELRACLLR